MLTSEKIESTFVGLLQRRVKVVCENKVVKTGKLLLVSKKNAAICMVITNQRDEPKNYEIPYPFGYSYNEDNISVRLDYTIETLCHGKTTNIDEIMAILPVKTGRFLNKIVRVLSVD